MTRAAVFLVLGLMAASPALAQAPQNATGRAPVPNVRAPVASVVQPSVAPAPAGNPPEDPAGVSRPAGV